jgi:hypothetical protein
MSDRVQPYYRQNVTWAEIEQWHDQLEAADRALASDHIYWGVVDGLEVTEDAPPSLSVIINEGVAYDALGQRIDHHWGVGSTFVNLTAYVPAVAGQERYVGIYLEFARIASDPRVDGDGAPLNYLEEEGWATYKAIGTAGAPAQPKPAIVANKVLLAVVHLTNGMGTIVNADISMAWYGLTGGAGAGSADRQVGGVIAPGRLLGTDRRLAWDSTLAETVLTIGAANTLNVSGGTITMVGGLIDMGSGDLDSDSGNLIKANMVNAEEPDPAASKGFLYADPATGALRTVLKPWDIHASTMAPGAQTTHPWAASLVDNNWAIGTTSRIEWTMLWNGAAAGVARQGVSLIIPIEVPNGCRIDRVTLCMNLNAILPVGDQLEFVCGVASLAKDGSGITVHTTKAYKNSSVGIWSVTGHDNVIAMSTSDPEITVINGDGATTVGSTYYAYCYMNDLAGVGNNVFVTIQGATVTTKIRDASHVY